MWGAASFLFRCARCSGTPLWVRGSRSSRRCPYRVAVPPEGGGAPPALGGRRAAPVAPRLWWVRGGGGGAAPPPALGSVWEGGGWYLVSGIWLTRPRLRHSRRGSLKMRDSQPPRGSLLGPARAGRSGRPMPAPCATRG